MIEVLALLQQIDDQKAKIAALTDGIDSLMNVGCEIQAEADAANQRLAYLESAIERLATSAKTQTSQPITAPDLTLVAR